MSIIQVVRAKDEHEAFEQSVKTSVFLVVDDFDSMRKATSNQLRQLGATRIYEAANGAEALKVLSRQPISVIISDWNMPVMSGFDLLLTVRSTPELFRLPFMMITSEADRERVTMAIQVGVSQLLVKPYTAGRLAEKLATVFKWQPRHNQPIDPVAVSSALGLDVQVGSQHKASAPKKVELLDLNNLPQTPNQTTTTPSDLSLPSQPVGSTTQAVAPAKAKAEKPTILVVDDTPDNLTLLAHIFKDDYKVKIAHRGDKALHICHSDNPPDLVLLDIMMPEMDGFEVAQLLRGHPSSEHIPIIFVTALTDDDSRQKALELGAVDFVTKPVDPNGLQIKVRNFMRYIELHRALQTDYDNMMQMERLKSDVDQITRHDMKAPLSGVIGLAQSLVDASNLTVDQREQIQMIEETAMQVLNMFNLSNEIFKIEAGRFKLNPQPVDVPAIVRRSVDLMRKTFAVKSLTFNVHTPPGFTDDLLGATGDPMLCYSLFQNLMKNACEAAPENSTITVSLTKGTSVQTQIRNTGAVPAHIRQTFFDKFATAGKSEGTGLGTYSAKLLVEAQNGQITMQTSDTDNSTTLTVSLPSI